jgi:hypothetical protein
MLAIYLDAFEYVSMLFDVFLRVVRKGQEPQRT